MSTVHQSLFFIGLAIRYNLIGLPRMEQDALNLWQNWRGHKKMVYRYDDAGEIVGFDWYYAE